MFKVLKHNHSHRQISHNGYTLGVISQVTDFEKIPFHEFDGFVIDTLQTVEARKIISHVRVKNELLESLKPLFIQSSCTFPKAINCHCDGILDPNQLGIVMERVAVISKKIKQIKVVTSTTYENSVTIKILSYLYTRNCLLQPLLNRQSAIGYIYPLLSLFFKKNEVLPLFQLVNNMVTNGLLNTQLKDHIHLCKGCHGNYFNFREVCSACKSIDITPHDMIHHFVCAHVAPATDFINGDQLTCPKCDKQLRHIGIDYDKPSTIYHCNCCSNEFQNPKMEALCMDCGIINDLEELNEQSIYEYSITQKGEQLLFTPSSQIGIKNNQSVSSENKYSVSFFEIVLKQEIARIKTHQCQSVYVQILISNPVLTRLNTLAKQAFHAELLQIISPYLLESDIIASDNYELFHVLLPNTSFKNLERLENIEYNVQKLLNDNIEVDNNQVEIKIHNLTAIDIANELINQ